MRRIAVTLCRDSLLQQSNFADAVIVASYIDSKCKAGVMANLFFFGLTCISYNSNNKS